MPVLLDTHAWVWTYLDSRRLPARVRNLVKNIKPALICAVSIYEVANKARLGKWPEAHAFIDSFDAVRQGVGLADVDGAVAMLAAQLDWALRDPFDRLIAATAISRHATLISADAQFDDLDGRPDWPGRLW